VVATHITVSDDHLHLRSLPTHTSIPHCVKVIGQHNLHRYLHRNNHHVFCCGGMHVLGNHRILFSIFKVGVVEVRIVFTVYTVDHIDFAVYEEVDWCNNL
jgi:hypothetical protein